MGFWTVERIEQLRIMKADGKTGAEMALALGCSRNAILGKSFRLGLGVPKQGPGISDELMRNTTPKRRCEPSRAMPKVSTEGIGFLLPALTAPEPLKGPGATIVEVQGCRWPITAHDAPRDAHRFCDAAVKGDGPYCPAHHKAAHAKAPSEPATVKRFRVPTSLLRAGVA